MTGRQDPKHNQTAHDMGVRLELRFESRCDQLMSCWGSSSMDRARCLCPLCYQPIPRANGTEVVFQGCHNSPDRVPYIFSSWPLRRLLGYRWCGIWLRPRSLPYYLWSNMLKQLPATSVKMTNWCRKVRQGAIAQPQGQMARQVTRKQEGDR